MAAGTGKRIWRFIMIGIAIYILGGLIAFLIQDMIIFHPRSVSRDHIYAFDQPFEEYNIKSGQHNLNIVRLSPADSIKGIVLFFHGNMNNVEYYKKYPSFFINNHYEVWMLDYPGFGKTTGKRTEGMMYQHSLMMYEMASGETGSDSIIIYGKSIGTGVASFLASQKPCRQLILETPYYSLPALASRYLPLYPVSWLIKYSFPNHEYLQQVKVPVTIFHGTDDETIPYKHAVRLKNENPDIELVTIENGRHNDLSDFNTFSQKLDSLLTR